ncbi:TPA: beta strand repeat-containing protein, partial [Haemophilus influenzae]
GDERGEGKNGIQLAKKTTLEKGSTINVSGKEKGGRAIVWGDIALIDGNINAQGKDIAKTGGFVETSGHYLSIDNNVIVKTKEWLLDPNDVSIEAPIAGRDNSNTDDEFILDSGTKGVLRKNNPTKTKLTNTTISEFLKNANVVNITASNNIYVNSSINIGSDGHLILSSEGKNKGGVKINENITSEGGSLTINSGGWVDVHKNITLGSGFLNITTKAGDIAFEDKQGRSNLTITGKGTITSGNAKGFRFENVSLNGVDTGLLFTTQRDISTNNGNITNHFNGTLNITGKVNISMDVSRFSWYRRYNGRTYWNVSTLNVSSGSNFSLSINNNGVSVNGSDPNRVKGKGLNGITFSGDNTFNIATGSTANFTIKTSVLPPVNNSNYASFNGNISVLGGGTVNFELNASSAGLPTSGAIINSQNINVLGGSNLNLLAAGSTDTAFLIKNDLTLNSTGGNITLRQIEGIDSGVKKGVVAEKNITFEGGNITFGSQKATTEIKGNVTIEQNTNVILRGAYYGNSRKTLDITGNVTNKGHLTTEGNIININGNLTVGESATLKAITNYTFNVSGSFDNNGDSNISIAKGGVHFKDINNTKNLNITTNSSSTYSTVIEGNITNKKGGLNITNKGSDTEIQIGGNISQKEGNLTISSDKINITKQITIKKGVNGENSDSDTESQANLTIKTKELKLTENLNISGFNKAEITAKNGRDLTIGNSNDGNSGAEAKAVTFNNVKDSKISANGYNVTLNSKVETSGSNDSAQDSSDNNTGLTINAKNVTVSNDITSHKTVNITASEKLTTKADATINATNGNVKVTTQTGDIKGQVKSTSGDVEITASGDTLNVSNVSGSAVTITADKGKLTAQAGSTVSATNGVTASSQSGDIGGTISGKTVNVKATERLTTQKGSKIEATEGEANVTSATGTIGGTVSGDTVNIKATDKLTTQAGSSITSAEGQVDLSARDGNI